jgi:hypothetical protein
MAEIGKLPLRHIALATKIARDEKLPLPLDDWPEATASHLAWPIRWLDRAGGAAWSLFDFALPPLVHSHWLVLSSML